MSPSVSITCRRADNEQLAVHHVRVDVQGARVITASLKSG
jgi:hypothetical protein